MPAAAMARWIDACGGQKSQRVNLTVKDTHDESVVLLFTEPEEICELEVASTRGLAGGVRNGLLIPWSIGTLAGLEGLFCTFVLMLNLVCVKSVSCAINVWKDSPRETRGYRLFFFARSSFAAIVVLYKLRRSFFDIFEGSFEDALLEVGRAGAMVREEENVG